MRLLSRAATAGALTVPLLFGGASMAFAGGYDGHDKCKDDHCYEWCYDHDKWCDHDCDHHWDDWGHWNGSGINVSGINVGIIG